MQALLWVWGKQQGTKQAGFLSHEADIPFPYSVDKGTQGRKGGQCLSFYQLQKNQ